MVLTHTPARGPLSYSVEILERSLYLTLRCFGTHGEAAFAVAVKQAVSSRWWRGYIFGNKHLYGFTGAIILAINAQVPVQPHGGNHRVFDPRCRKVVVHQSNLLTWLVFCFYRVPLGVLESFEKPFRASHTLFWLSLLSSDTGVRRRPWLRSGAASASGSEAPAERGRTRFTMIYLAAPA